MPLNVVLGILIPCLQDAQGLLVDVLKLSAVDGPAQHGQDGQHEQHRDRDQDVEDFHGVAPSRSEFSTTSSELSAMPRPATQGGNRPISARGMQLKL